MEVFPGGKDFGGGLLSKIQIRKEGTPVPDGWSVTDIGTNTLHVKVQHTLPSGSVIRGYLQIPKNTASDPSTWRSSKTAIILKGELSTTQP